MLSCGAGIVLAVSRSGSALTAAGIAVTSVLDVKTNETLCRNRRVAKPLIEGRVSWDIQHKTLYCSCLSVGVPALS